MVELREFIRELRSELQEARTEGTGEPLQFELGPVQLELSVAVTEGGEGEAKVRFWVVELGGGGKMSQEATQRMTLTLHPKLAATGGTVTVTGAASAQER